MNAQSYQTIKQMALANGLWLCMPVAGGSGGKAGLRFEGYVVPPMLLVKPFSVNINGKKISLNPLTGNQFENVFARYDTIQSKRDSLRFSFSLINPSIFPKQDEISIHFDESQCNSLLPFYYAKSDNLPVPKPEGMMRTTNNADIDIFNYTGLTDCRRIQFMMSEYFGARLAEMQVLDWGCGAGRVSRFVEKIVQADCLFGVDTDPVNIKWAREHLDDQRYSLISFEPSLPFKDGKFDLIYGISVMTHLKLTDQRAWLSELHRVLRPKGYLILTYLGLATFFTNVNHGPILEQLLTNGFLDAGRNPGLDEGHKESKEKDLYRNVFNTLDNIASLTSDLFEIALFVPGGSSAHHDYVVFRKL
jgi:SAM-dependent methyltransferase